MKKFLPPLPSEARAVTSSTTASLTEADVSNMSGPALVSSFNALTGENVKRFATPADGRKRLLAAIEKARGAAPKAGRDGIALNQIDKSGTSLRETTSTFVEKRVAELNGTKKLSGRSDRKFPETLKITLLVDKNPKRAGSSSAKVFALYRTGMTVAEFVRAGGSSLHLKWDANHNFIKVS